MPGAVDAEQAWARITVPHIAQRPVMRRSPDGGMSFPRSSSKGYRYEVAIQLALPNRPTTVPTFDHASSSGQALMLDLDTSRVPAEGAADRTGYITAVVERIVEMVTECGGRALVDRSPSGGAHIYVLWASPIPFHDLRQLARACALRFHPVVDTSPMENTDAQIRGPGSPHKSQGGRLTGFMTLTCSVEEAEAICAAPCGEQVWSALQVELAAELDAVAGRRDAVLEARHPRAPDTDPSVDLDDAGEPFRARLGGRARRLSDPLEQTARTADYDTARYPSSSEARQAILTSAAARGWRLEHVRASLAADWAPIASWWRDDHLLQAEWAKAITYTAHDQKPGAQEVGDPVSGSNTRGINLTPPFPPPSGPACAERRPEDIGTHSGQDLYNVRGGGLWGGTLRSAPWQLTIYQQIRTWQNAMRIVERLQETVWGERALSYRAILRAIGAAAQMSGSTTIEFGTRQLAYAAAVDHTTVCRALQILREGPYALIDLVQDAKGIRADLYELVIPDVIAADATRRTWRPGRIEAIHPAFRVLGRPAAFLYEALSTSPASVRELAAAALLPRSTAYTAIAVLAEHGLAEQTADGWRRGPTDLDTVADRTGADDLAAEQLAGHRADRTEWHAFLGIVSPADIDARTPQAAAGRRHTDEPYSGRHDRSDGRRRAPPWLIPPPRDSRITEADLTRPPDIEAELAALAEHTPCDRSIPDDVRAAMHADLACVADDERAPAENAAYDAELQVLREFRLQDAAGRT
ncbi:helix-turn-helix domain-containing protein [Actinomadura sp. 9N215]|uniref:helix-turn-helix domain-containing protein n=1 Tax=Actinomadura sp. 9N215 TaxID=3375150 RepID=UPI0037BE13A2